MEEQKNIDQLDAETYEKRPLMEPLIRTKQEKLDAEAKQDVEAFEAAMIEKQQAEIAAFKKAMFTDRPTDRYRIAPDGQPKGVPAIPSVWPDGMKPTVPLPPMPPGVQEQAMAALRRSGVMSWDYAAAHQETAMQPPEAFAKAWTPREMAAKLEASIATQKRYAGVVPVPAVGANIASKEWAKQMAAKVPHEPDKAQQDGAYDGGFATNPVPGTEQPQRKSKLPGSFDARDWASEFVEMVRNNPAIPTDEGTMAGWFANAISAGYDRARYFVQPPVTFEQPRTDMSIMDILYSLANMLELSATESNNRSHAAFLLKTGDAFELARRVRIVCHVMNAKHEHGRLLAIKVAELAANVGRAEKNHMATVSRYAGQI